MGFLGIFSIFRGALDVQLRCVRNRLLALSLVWVIPSIGSANFDNCGSITFDDVLLALQTRLHPSNLRVYFDVILTFKRAGVNIQSVQRPWIRLSPGNSLAEVSVLLAKAFPSLNEIQVQHYVSRAQREPVFLQELMPESLKASLEKNAPCDGPNCFNATLAWYKPKQTSLRFTSPNEIKGFLLTECTALRSHETIVMGDVLVFYHGTDIIHTAVFLDGNVVFHKPGVKREQRWVFDTLANTLATYLLDGVQVKIFRPVRRR